MLSEALRENTTLTELYFFGNLKEILMHKRNKDSILFIYIKDRTVLKRK